MEELHMLLDMEESLSKDAEGRYLRTLRESFQARSLELSQYLGQGLPEEEYRKHAELGKALQLADSMVEKVWRFMHTRPA
jgi:hypothetical protein